MSETMREILDYSMEYWAAKKQKANGEIKVQQSNTNEKERLKYCISRYDSFYDSVNNKSAVFLAMSTFIVGGLVAAYPSMIEKINCNLWVHLLMGSMIIVGVINMTIIIIAATPFLSKDEISLHYFNSIADQEKVVFETRSQTLTEQGELEDLRSQVYYLAKGLQKKFQRLHIAGRLFIVQLAMFLPLILLLILNLK